MGGAIGETMGCPKLLDWTDFGWSVMDWALFGSWRM